MRPAEAIANVSGKPRSPAGRPPGAAPAPRHPSPARAAALFRYAEALAAVAAASALRLLLEPLLDGQAPFHLALLATAWAAARGGFGPALLAGAVGLAVAALALLPPRWDFAVSDPAQRNGALLYAATAFAVALVGGRLHAARERAEAALAARIQAERALSGEEAHTRAILDLSPQVLWTARPDGGIEDFAERWLAWTGMAREEALADGWKRAVHPGDLTRVAEAWTRSVGTGEPYDVEHRVRMADGSMRWMRSRAVPRRDPATGAVLRWHGTTEDVHDRHGAEAGLRRALAEQRAVHASAPVALSLHDRELRFRAVNGRMAAINGLPAEAHLGRTPAEAVPPIAGDVEPLLRRVLGTGEPIDGVEIETETAAHPGERRHYLAAYHPVREEGGDGVDGVSVAVLDITGRKRAEAALRRLAATLEARVGERTARLAEVVAELDAFAYTVSHDLRAPLRAMEGFARILEEEHGEALDAAGRRYARRIVEAAERLDGLIQDLLAYSRLSRAEVEARPVSLEDAVDRAVRDLPEGAAEVSVERPLPTVLGARPVLGAILGNLLSNAVKFAEAGRRPRVRVRAEARPGGLVRLWVEDDGIGIAPEHLDRIFQVFERLHGQEHYPGTGIGLAIVRKGAERSGGRAGAESDGPGRGSRFWVELPGTTGA